MRKEKRSGVIDVILIECLLILPCTDQFLCSEALLLSNPPGRTRRTPQEREILHRDALTMNNPPFRLFLPLLFMFWSITQTMFMYFQVWSVPALWETLWISSRFHLPLQNLPDPPGIFTTDGSLITVQLSTTHQQPTFLNSLLFSDLRVHIIVSFPGVTEKYLNGPISAPRPALASTSTESPEDQV